MRKVSRRTLLAATAGVGLSVLSLRWPTLRRKSDRIQDGKSTKNDVTALFGPPHPANIGWLPTSRPGVFKPGPPIPLPGNLEEVWEYDFDDISSFIWIFP